MRARSHKSVDAPKNLRPTKVHNPSAPDIWPRPGSQCSCGAPVPAHAAASKMLGSARLSGSVPELHKFQRVYRCDSFSFRPL
jgi:hypothetical protein